MKYYEIVIYTVHDVTRLTGLDEETSIKFKNWLCNDEKYYIMTYEKSLLKTRTETTVIYKNNIHLVDFDLLSEEDIKRLKH